MQLLPVVQVTGQSLGLLSMPDVYHVHGQVKVRLTLFKAFLVFNLEVPKQAPLREAVFESMIRKHRKEAHIFVRSWHSEQWLPSVRKVGPISGSVR